MAGRLEAEYPRTTLQPLLAVPATRLCASLRTRILPLACLRRLLKNRLSGNRSQRPHARDADTDALLAEPDLRRVALVRGVARSEVGGERFALDVGGVRFDRGGGLA